MALEQHQQDGLAPFSPRGVSTDSTTPLNGKVAVNQLTAALACPCQGVLGHWCASIQFKGYGAQSESSYDCSAHAHSELLMQDDKYF